MRILRTREKASKSAVLFLVPGAVNAALDEGVCEKSSYGTGRGIGFGCEG